MMANIGPGEAIGVKYVLNARKSSHGLLVWSIAGAVTDQDLVRCVVGMLHIAIFD